MHISAHILQYAKSDKNFARNIAQSQMGKVSVQALLVYMMLIL